MFDEMERLCASPPLYQLLAHYGGAAEMEVWQDRVMSLEGVSVAELTKLHGELLACEWVEQNTGVVSPLSAGIVARCYRVTRAGLRALKRAAVPAEDEDVAVAA
jgi:hypothetical protein